MYPNSLSPLVCGSDVSLCLQPLHDALGHIMPHPQPTGQSGGHQTRQLAAGVQRATPQANTLQRIAESADLAKTN